MGIAKRQKNAHLGIASLQGEGGGGENPIKCQPRIWSLGGKKGKKEEGLHENLKRLIPHASQSAREREGARMHASHSVCNQRLSRDQDGQTNIMDPLSPNENFMPKGVY